MKRRALLGHLQEHGCLAVREGDNHSIWSNPQTGRKEAIPRHNDIKKFFGPLHLPQPVRTSSTGQLIAKSMFPPLEAERRVETLSVVCKKWANTASSHAS